MQSLLSLTGGDLSDIEVSFPCSVPDQSDTIARDRLDQLMNTITTTYYGLTLTRCPECCNVHVLYEGDSADEEFECKACHMTITHHDSPDFFF